MSNRLLSGRFFQEVVLRNVPNEPVAVALSSSAPARGVGYSPSVTFARTADTAAYLANDVIGVNAAGSPGSAILTLANAGPAGGIVQLLTAELAVNRNTLPAGSPGGFLLHLYSGSPTAILDNAPFSAAAADWSLYRGSVAFGAAAVIGGGFMYAPPVDFAGRVIRLTTSSLFGVLQTLGAFTPASGTEYSLRISTAEVSFS